MKPQIINIYPQPGKSTRPTDWTEPTWAQVARAVQTRIRMRRAVASTLATDKP
jgi:hypothetical protein